MRPTRIAELVPRAQPDTFGAQDAAATGMGGVHFVPQQDGSIFPLMWWSPFPQEIQTRLVTCKNPGGDINNNELELAASVAHHEMLAEQFDVREAAIQNFSDNVATVWWQRKCATSSSGPTSGLLRLQSLHQRHYHYVPLFDYITGEANAMVDACSRMWHLSDSQLLAYFDSTFPQSRPWQLCLLRKPMHCALISSLSRIASNKALLHSAPKQWTSIGRAGTYSMRSTMWTPTSKHGWIRSPSSKSLVKDTEMEGWLPAKKPVRARTVEDGLRAVGHAHTRLGAPDPRKDSHGGIDFRIQRQIKVYTKEDSPPRRATLVPIIIIVFIMAQAFRDTCTDAEMAIANMITITFFLLLRPSEYTGTMSDDAAFKLQDFHLYI
jgi:hypothetical protein